MLCLWDKAPIVHCNCILQIFDGSISNEMPCMLCLWDKAPIVHYNCILQIFDGSISNEDLVCYVCGTRHQ